MTNVELTPEPLAPAVIAAGAPPVSSPARDARMAPLAAEAPDAFALIEAAHAQIAKTLAAATGEFAARTFKHQSSMELAREIGALTLSLARVAKMLEPPKEPRPSRRVSRFAERRAAHFAHFAEAEPPAPAAAGAPAKREEFFHDEEELTRGVHAGRSVPDIADYTYWLRDHEHAGARDAGFLLTRAGTQLEDLASLPLQRAGDAGPGETRAGDSGLRPNGAAPPEPPPHQPDNMNAPAATTAPAGTTEPNLCHPSTCNSARAMSSISIRPDDLSSPQTQALVARHLAGMHATSPPESVHAFDVAKLKGEGVYFWSAWDGDTIAGMGALKRLDGRRGEIKSMRVADEFLGRGVGRAILGRIIDEARAMGLVELYLETGSNEAFAPALSLYQSEGFAFCGPFADYTNDPFSRFMKREL